MSKLMNPAAPEASAELILEAASGKRSHQRFRRTRRWVWRSLGLLALVAMVVLAAFGPFPWQLLGQGTLLLSVVVVVLLALGVLMPEKPDFVLSGINHGQNMGEDVFYSGTVAAAMEGLVAGVPSIAISYCGSDLELLETHKEGLRALLRRIFAVRDFPAETLLNINLPAIPGDQVKGVKVTHLGSRVFSEEIALMKDPWGKEIYWIGGGRITWTGGADSDFRATADGYISVTPLHMDMTNYRLLETVRSWLTGD